MRSFTRRLVLCVAVPALSAVAAPATAQEVAAFGVVSNSNNREFPSPRGFGVSALAVVNSGWLFRLSYVRTYDSTVKPGTVCINYSQRIGCRTETVSTSDSFSGLRFGVMRALHLKDYVRVGAGIGLSFNSIRLSGRGESGLREDVELPLGGEIGYLAMLHLKVSPLPRIPIAFIAGLQQHWVHFDGCSDPPVYAPFCGVDAFHEAELGIAYIFG